MVRKKPVIFFRFFTIHFTTSDNPFWLFSHYAFSQLCIGPLPHTNRLKNSVGDFVVELACVCLCLYVDDTYLQNSKLKQNCSAGMEKKCVSMLCINQFQLDTAETKMNRTLKIALLVEQKVKVFFFSHYKQVRISSILIAFTWKEAVLMCSVNKTKLKRFFFWNLTFYLCILT